MPHRLPFSSRRMRPLLRSQQGMVLIEALVAIVIFSIGVVGITALQSSSIKASSAAEYRSIAALQANDLIGRMWASKRALLTTNFVGPASAGSSYTTWLSSVQAALPGVSSSMTGVLPTDTRPVVTVTSIGTAPSVSYVVNITMYWAAPGESTAHTYSVRAQVQ